MLKVLSGFFWLYIILLTEIMTRWLGFEWTSSPLFWRQNSGMNEMLSVPGPKKICINYYINMASGYRSYFHISFSIFFFFKLENDFVFKGLKSKKLKNCLWYIRSFSVHFNLRLARSFGTNKTNMGGGVCVLAAQVREK